MAPGAEFAMEETPIPISMPLELNGSIPQFTKEELEQLSEMGIDPLSNDLVVDDDSKFNNNVNNIPIKIVHKAKFQNVQRVGKNKVLSNSSLGTGGIDPFMTMDFVKAKSMGSNKGTSEDYMTTQHSGVIYEKDINSKVLGFVPPNMRGMSEIKGSKKHHKADRRRK